MERSMWLRVWITVIVLVVDAALATSGFAAADGTVTLKTTSKTFNYKGGTATISFSVVGERSSQITILSRIEGGAGSWLHLGSGVASQQVKLNAKGIWKGSLKFAVNRNDSSTPRSGVLRIQGVAFTVSQAGAPCTVAMARTTSPFTAVGEEGSFAVDTPDGCKWTASVDERTPWITIEGGAVREGSGSVAFSVEANPTSKVRTGKIYVVTGGSKLQKKIYTVKQKASSVIPPDDLVASKLNSGKLVTSAPTEGCENSFVLDAVSQLCELLAPVTGGDACVTQTSSCNSYARQLYTGSVLGHGPKGARWNARGGSGSLMADAAICTLRELSPKVPGGGPVRSKTPPLDIGIGDVVVEQEVGYLDFDRTLARFKGYRKLGVELPVIGSFDAITQNIDVRRVFYGTEQLLHQTPNAGDYPLLFGYGLNVSTEEKKKSIQIDPGSFEITTPIGIFTVSPHFTYKSNTVVADIPFSTEYTYVILPDDPYDNSPAAIKLYDLYGIIPGIWNNATPRPNLGDYQTKRTGWISQLGLGARGSIDDLLWSPPSGGFFSRPDYDPTGVLKFEDYESRSAEENLPSVYAEASASFKYPENPAEMLPDWVDGLPGLDWDAYIKVTPTIKAGAAGQFGIAVSEGTDNKAVLEGEFYAGEPSSRFSALGIYSGVEANASFDVLAELRLYVSAVFNFFLGEKTITLVDIHPKFPIHLAGGDPVSSSVELAAAYSSSGSTPDIPEKLDFLNTFKGQKFPEEFINLCYAKETEVPPEEPPEPESKKGSVTDLFEYLYCNICLATDAIVDPSTGEVKEPAHKDILAPVSPTPPAVWQCDASSKSGCMDLCKLDKTTGEFTVVKNPSEIADSLPASTPDYEKLHAFYKSCMLTCTEPIPGIFDASCGKGLDSAPPGLLALVPGGGGNAPPAPVDTTIAASFTEKMDPASINTSTFTLKDADGNVMNGDVSYVAARYTAEFTPWHDLGYNSTYTATLTTGVRDVAGNELPADFSWSFTTEAAPDVTPPELIATTPVPAATDVSVTAGVSVIFSEAVDPATITSESFFLSDGRGKMPGSIFFTDGGTVVLFDPSTDLAFGTTYVVTVTAAVQDLAGNPLAAEYTWSFNTAPEGVGGKIVFVTSTKGKGDLRTWADARAFDGIGVAAGDAICRARAESAGLANTVNFKAWLSDTTTGAIARIVSDGPWFKSTGEKVADSKADLMDGFVAAAIDTTETGAYLATQVWTGTGRDGQLSVGGHTCNEWTDSADTRNGAANSGGTGESSLSDGRWTNEGDSLCSSDRSLYCFED